MIMKLGFVFTNYNNSSYTRSAVQSILLNSNSPDTYIAIVDNQSEEKDIDSLKEIKKDFPEIHLILNDKNSGYFGGLNIGIKHLRENFENIDYLVIGNNDLVFPADFIDNVQKNLRLFEIYPIISPDLITLDGIHQNPHVIKGLSKFRETIFDIYFTNYRLAKIINFIAKMTRRVSDRKDEQQFEVAQTISQGYGACYILGPVFFSNFDLLWAPTFLMGEELFLSKQLESRGLQIYYEPGIIVNHHDHGTLSKMPGKKLWEISRESHKIYRKYVKNFI